MSYNKNEYWFIRQGKNEMVAKILYVYDGESCVKLSSGDTTTINLGSLEFKIHEQHSILPIDEIKEIYSYQFI